MPSVGSWISAWLPTVLRKSASGQRGGILLASLRMRVYNCSTAMAADLGDIQESAFQELAQGQEVGQASTLVATSMVQSCWKDLALLFFPESKGA